MKRIYLPHSHHRLNLKDKGKRIRMKPENGSHTVQDISGILAIWPIPDKDFVHPSA
jgi:hypothetical protein